MNNTLILGSVGPEPVESLFPIPKEVKWLLFKGCDAYRTCIKVVIRSKKRERPSSGFNIGNWPREDKAETYSKK